MLRSSLTKFVLCCLAFTLLFAATPTAVPAQVGITVSFGPPAIPYYEQPENPTPNWIWEPGYWQYDFHGGGYYWVPGTWVPAPDPGLLWTPGYWAWDGSEYIWNPGYWASDVGYYGGVNYGYGYYGRGYAGGRWHGRQFQYNTAVTRVSRNVRNVYVNRSVVAPSWNRVSYNGGRGGINARPTPQELNVQRGHHVAATPVQVRHAQFAAQNRNAFNNVNRGRPAVTAVARPLAAAAHQVPQRRATMPTNRMATQAHPAAHAQPAHGAPAHQAQHAAPAHQAQHAAPAHQAQRAAPAHVQAQHAAVTHHAAPQRAAAPRAAAAPVVHHAAAAPRAAAAPVVHHAAAAPVVHRAAPAAPAYHPAPVRPAAPAYHPAPAIRQAPAAHVAHAPAIRAAPAMRPAPAMRAAPVARPAAPARPAAARPAGGGDERDRHH